MHADPSLSPTDAGDVFDPARHGDEDTAAGVSDFAVNVRPGPPRFLTDALAARLDDLAAYPSTADRDAATAAIARAHGCDRSEVMLLGGAAEGFELLARLGARHVALIQPSFTEPERVLRAAGAHITQVVLEHPWELHTATIPDDADLVVLGNPTNPTSVLHPRTAIEALRRSGRMIVVDEAFADITRDAAGAHEPETLTTRRPDDVIVIRSVTKTFALAGLRVGYLLASPTVIALLERGRRHWPLGTLALTALQVCAGDDGRRYARQQADTVAADRAYLVDRLKAIGLRPAGTPASSYVMVDVVDGLAIKAELRRRGIGVRSCANFVGLGPDWLRLAVRSRELTDHLVSAMQDVMRAAATTDRESGSR